MSILKTAKFEDTCVDDCHLKIVSTASQRDYIFNEKPARQRLNCFKICKISEDGDETIYILFSWIHLLLQPLNN